MIRLFGESSHAMQRVTHVLLFGFCSPFLIMIVMIIILIIIIMMMMMMMMMVTVTMIIEFNFLTE